MSEQGELLNSTVTTIPKTTSIRIGEIIGNQFTIDFDGLPSNNPDKYSNYLVVWRNSNTVPWTDASDAYAQVLATKSQGSQVIEVPLQVDASYIVGYAVGAKGDKDPTIWKNVCATGFIPKIGDPGEYFSPSLSDFVLRSDSISLKYELPDLATPKTNGAWIGIWEAGVPSYTQAPKASNAISMDTARGGALINGVKILRGQTYTVALFTSGWKAGTAGANVQTAMACSASFTV